MADQFNNKEKNDQKAKIKKIFINFDNFAAVFLAIFGDLNKNKTPEKKVQGFK